MDFLTLAQDIRIIEGFGGAAWANQTTLHPLGAAITAMCCAALILLPRRWSVIPIFVLACFVASAQRIVIAGIDFSLLRILVMAGFARVLMNNEWKGVTWHRLDLLILVFAGVRTAIYTLQHMTPAAFIFQAGQTFDAVGFYVLFRILLRDVKDVARAAAALAVITVPLLVFFAIENQTGRNLFSVFGGVPEFTMIREGRRRCQGAFAHPIIAGCWWASLLPIMAALWWVGGWSRWIGAVGVFCALGIIVFCASSTPVAGVMFGMIGAGMYLLRKYMLWIQLGTVAALIGLHIVMIAPVWHLVARVSLARGSTSHFRFMLIDSAIRRFDEWALLGTRSTAHWFWGAQDITNHYILEGVRGGALSLALFVAIIFTAFRMVGAIRAGTEKARALNIFVWAMGVSLFVHCTNFIGVSYFGQGPVVWFFTLATIGSVYEQFRASTRPPRGRVGATAAPTRA